MLEDFIGWKYPEYIQRNPSSWLSNPELKNIWDNTSGPFNSPDPVECFILYTLAKNCSGNCLEFGSWKGRSSCFIAKGIHDSEMPDRKLHCVDWFKGDKTGGHDPDKQEMINSLTRFDLLKYVDIIDDDMLQIDYDQFSNIDLVFYDSDHHTGPTVQVLSKIRPKLNKQCPVIVHDAKWPLAANAVQKLSDLCMYDHLITLPVWEGLAILRKK